MGPDVREVDVHQARLGYRPTTEKAKGDNPWPIAGLLTQPSLINIDFADVRPSWDGDVGFNPSEPERATTRSERSGAGPQEQAAGRDFENAKGALIHISGASDLTLGDAIKAGEIITERMDPKANVKWGARIVPGYEGQLEIVAIVTGVRAQASLEIAQEKKGSVSFSDSTCSDKVIRMW